MIFKGVQEGRPYPDVSLSPREWAQIPPRQFRLDELITVTTVLALDRLLSEDSTFYGDLFAHVVQYRGEMYLEDGLHRAVRSALRNRTIVHARLLDLDDPAAHGAPLLSGAEAGTPSINESTDQLPPVVVRPANPRRTGRPSRGAHRAAD